MDEPAASLGTLERLVKRRAKLQRDIDKAAAEAYKAGASLREVADVVGLSVEKVRQNLLAADVELRAPSHHHRSGQQ